MANKDGTSENLSAQGVKDFLSYDPDTGKFTWIGKPSAGVHIGDAANCISPTGYVVIQFRGKKYPAHRLAFYFMLGYIPCEVDHKDGDRSNNSWSNLRSVSRQENTRNAKLRTDNTSGVVGVAWDRDRWVAYIGKDGKLQQLGRFLCFEEAVLARKEAERLYGYHINHGRVTCEL